jgi:hypothetical protein
MVMSSVKGELKMNFHFLNSGSSSISSLTVLAKQEHLHDNVCFKDDLAGYDHNPIVPITIVVRSSMFHRSGTESSQGGLRHKSV